MVNKHMDAIDKVIGSVKWKIGNFSMLAYTDE